MLFTPNDPNPSTLRSKRGGRKDRPSQVRERVRSEYPNGHVASKSDPAVAHKTVRSGCEVIENGGVFNTHLEISEDCEQSGLVPFRSLSHKLMLGIGDQERETVTMGGKQVNRGRPFYKRRKLAGWEHVILNDAAPMPAATHYMVEVTTERQVWKQDRTLLTTSKPCSEIGTYKRAGAIRDGAISQQYIRTEREHHADTIETINEYPADIDLDD